MQRETNTGTSSRTGAGESRAAHGRDGRNTGTSSRAGVNESLWARFVMRMRADRRVELAVYGGIALIVIVLYLLASGLESSMKDKAQASSGVQVTSVAEADIEQRLKEVLSCIRGAGKVEVMITYDTSREIVPAMTTSVNSTGSETSDGGKSSSSQQSTESTQPATVSGSDGNSPIVLKEIEPIVRGVIVVAEGAADVSVRMDLQRAVRAVLDIPLSRIEVFERSAQPKN